MRSARPIVCLSTQYWRDNPFRKHIFMRRLASRGHRILYVEPSTSIVRKGVESERGVNEFLRARLWAAEPGIVVLSPPRMLPKSSVPPVSELDNRRVARLVRHVCAREELHEPVLWIYPPRFAHVTELMPHSHVVFDLVDDYVGYVTGEAARRYMRRCMDALMRRADRAIVTSPKLVDLYPEEHPALVPNGYDETLFHPGVAPHRSLRGLTQVVGFVGTLFDHLDYHVLLGLARSLPQASIVLVGRRETTSAQLDQVLCQPNVHWYGPVLPQEVPAFVAGFDVCIAPFLPGAVADSVSPLKVYEYLALQKPVICSPMAGLTRDPIGRFIRFAENGSAFIAAVAAALGNPEQKSADLADALRDCTWSARFAQVAAYLGEEVLYG